jgi:hypothetical protein
VWAGQATSQPDPIVTDHSCYAIAMPPQGFGPARSHFTVVSAPVGPFFVPRRTVRDGRGGGQIPHGAICFAVRRASAVRILSSEGTDQRSGRDRPRRGNGHESSTARDRVCPVRPVGGRLLLPPPGASLRSAAGGRAVSTAVSAGRGGGPGLAACGGAPAGADRHAGAVLIGGPGRNAGGSVGGQTAKALRRSRRRASRCEWRRGEAEGKGGTGDGETPAAHRDRA